ncbi:unnamed protein product [Meloidogyne enterolobii]|uniref:Uncharacterized protein n=1 Tax=Meloidogyne enterolobii TaxID=390850 RepID=A0ACB0ZEK2_MELEN
MEIRHLVSHEHFMLLKKFSSEILQKCTKPGMLSKLDLLCPNVTVQEFFEVDISSSKQRERLRNHFIKAILNDNESENILNKIAIEIISFIRLIDKIITQLEGVGSKKSVPNKSFNFSKALNLKSDDQLKDFRLTEVLKYTSDYDKIFNMNIEGLIKEQTILNIQQFKFYKKLIKNKNIQELTIDIISDYLKEKSVKIFISASERKEFLKWRQMIVANEFYEELGINNEIMLQNESENREIFKEQISKGFSSSFSSLKRLYNLIGPENARKSLSYLNIKFEEVDELKNLEEIEEEYFDEEEINNINKGKIIEDSIENDTEDSPFSKDNNSEDETNEVIQKIIHHRNDILDSLHNIISEQQTKTKARKSKRQRNKEKKKNLQVENLEEQSGGNIEFAEISDNKVENVEGESNTEEISSPLLNDIKLGWILFFKFLRNKRLRENL